MLYRYKGNNVVTRDDLPPNTVLMIERSTTIGDDTPKDAMVTCVRKLTREEMTAAGLTECEEIQP